MIDLLAYCRSCNAPIIWARNQKSGKLMPLDAEPSDVGTWVIDDADGGEGLEAHVTGKPAELVAYHEPGSLEPRRTSHFATCPQASSWRRR